MTADRTQVCGNENIL